MMPDMAKLKEIEDWLLINTDEDSDVDAVAYAAGMCGKTQDGCCTFAGTEHCEFDCPFRDD
jgi:hypothetical protein